MNRWHIAVAVALAATTFLASVVFGASTELVSADSSGIPGNDDSGKPSISADGRFVAFDSLADNLVPGDTNDSYDVFVRDRVTGQTARVSVDSSGFQGDGASIYSSISADGRFAVFSSDAANLVPDDRNNAPDVFVHDRVTGRTTIVSVDSKGGQGYGMSLLSGISADGRFVAFESTSSNLVCCDANDVLDVFVHDRLTGGTTTASVNSEGLRRTDPGGYPGVDPSGYPSISADGRFVSFMSLAPNPVPGGFGGGIFMHDLQAGRTTAISVNSSGVQAGGVFSSVSADGRFVAFDSLAGNLVPGDTNGTYDVFVRDRVTGQTARVSVDSSGLQGNGASTYPSISADGRFVAFESHASNLVRGDRNGYADVFVHDRLMGQTTVVSVDSSGVLGNDDSGKPSISADGRFVAFESLSTNLVPGIPADANTVHIFVHDRGRQPANTRCAATLSNDFRLHMPIIDFQGNTHWAVFQNVPNTPDFVLIDTGLVVDSTPFRGCAHSVLSREFRFGLPDVMFAGKSYWAELTYKGGVTVTLTWAGVN